jgi:erythronate-4-phosphate dehydrogenase
VPLRIVADANIPYAGEAFGRIGQVHRVPGQQIEPAFVEGADVLLVRSVTRVGSELLQKSRVRFVGSATIGTDHVDRDYLRERRIAFAHAPGSNAQSVVEYVLAALLAVYAGEDGVLWDRTVGVVGCGHIGGRLAARLPALGARVLRCDPPLTRTGPHPTYHLIGADELAAMRPGALLVNASRGAVVDNAALREALDAGRIGGAVLDVWEDEPTPDPVLLRQTRIATPHIAGYSFDGKVRGTAMLYDALVAWLDAPAAWDAAAVLAADGSQPLRAPAVKGETAWLDALVRQAYDLRADDARMRALLDLPADERGAAFHRLRKTYPKRRAWEHYRIAAAAVPPPLRTAVPPPLRTAVAEGLGFTLA